MNDFEKSFIMKQLDMPTGKTYTMNMPDLSETEGAVIELLRKSPRALELLKKEFPEHFL